jgi:hypothetical protein
MKKINTLIVLALLTLSFGCKKQAAVATTTTASKATLSSIAALV